MGGTAVHQTCSGNTIDMTGGTGSALQVDGDYATVIGNSIQTDCVFAAMTITGDSCTFTGNVFRTANTFDTDTGLIHFQNCNDNKFIGNTIETRIDSDQQFATRPGLLLGTGCRRNIIMGNNITGRGITDAVKSNLVVDGNANDGVIMGNVLRNIGTGAQLFSYDGAGNNKTGSTAETNPGSNNLVTT
jgi:hypothetical protein